MSRRLVAVLLLAWLTASTGPASPALAHGAGHTVVGRPLTTGGVVLAFGLSSGEPLADAAIILRAPDGVLHLTGRTDRLGRAAFVPDRPGPWRIEVTDAAGHSGSHTLDIGADLATPPEPAWRRWLLRGSLLANLVLAGLLLQAVGRGRRRPAAPLAGLALRPREEGTHGS